MIAAFLLSFSCTLVPASADAPEHNRCQRYEVQSWHSPTADELESCATMAESLTRMDHESTCEIVPMADEEEQVQPASYAAPRAPITLTF